jgi:hypothetical protein
MSEKDRPKPPQQTGGKPEEATEEPTPDDVLPGPVTGADVEAAVRGVDFPATARDLVDRARRNGADENVLHRLADLSERRYTSLGDALRSLDMLS